MVIYMCKYVAHKESNEYENSYDIFPISTSLSTLHVICLTAQQSEAFEGAFTLHLKIVYAVKYPGRSHR